MKFLLIILSLLLVSCAGVRSRYHTAVPGESWSSIASRYQVPVEDLQDHNEEQALFGIRPGDRLYIPFEESPTWNDDLMADRAPAQTGAREEVRAHFIWPVTGYVSSGFGRRKGKDHQGIDIPARTGTQVRAARSGHVIYAGNRIKGYGNLIIVRHADTYSTVYAHLSKIEVKKGQFVSRGQRIGRVGRTGHATSPHLHFEIRTGQLAVNPLLYLQAQYATNILGR